MFWPNVGHVLVEVYNSAFENGLLPESLRTAVTSLIFKSGEKELIENYRPISLTNIHYKILANALASRLQSVIDTIISRNQTACIKGRFIGHSIRLLLDIVEKADNNDTEGLLLFLDFKKAFDSLEWSFLYRVLEKSNFGPSFISWIKVLYEKPMTCIKNNGHTSNIFQIERGVRQGCPLSAQLFIIAAEALALSTKVRRLVDIH
jgi:hypothetical protein